MIVYDLYTVGMVVFPIDDYFSSYFFDNDIAANRYDGSLNSSINIGKTLRATAPSPEHTTKPYSNPISDTPNIPTELILSVRTAQPPLSSLRRLSRPCRSAQRQPLALSEHLLEAHLTRLSQIPQCALRLPHIPSACSAQASAPKIRPWTVQCLSRPYDRLNTSLTPCPSVSCKTAFQDSASYRRP